MHVGAKAAYAASSTLALTAGIEKEYSKTYEIWSGKRISRIFFGGPVLIEVYAEPSLSFIVEASASLTIGASMGISVEGDTEVGVIFDGGLRESYKPPSFDIDYGLPQVEGEASLGASATLLLSLETGIYGDFLSAEVGLSGGLEANIAAGFVALGLTDTVFIPTVNSFDVAFF